MKTSLKEKKPYYLTLTRKFIFYLVILLLAIVVLKLIFDDSASKGRLVFYIGQFLAMLIVLRISQFIEIKFNFKVPYLLDFSLITFAFCGLSLGDVFNFYGKFPIWDSILHTFFRCLDCLYWIYYHSISRSRVSYSAIYLTYVHECDCRLCCTLFRSNVGNWRISC